MKYLTLTPFILAGLMSTSAQAHHPGYWLDSSDNAVKTASGCLHTSQWSQDNIIPECEGVVEKKVVDSDSDGVEDANDQCPDTAAGTKVDSSGCAIDSDGDGVADGSDQCPGTPKGAQVNSNGCEVDSDGDGIADSLDQCPGTAANSDVDDKGCMIVRDSDADGILDANDKCPNTKAGTAVDTSGCELTADIRLDDINFKTGTAELDGKSQNILNSIAGILKANTHLSFEVAGHTDSTGNYDFNVQLSEKRAQSVRQYLVDQGVNADRLTAKGYGPDQPVATNETRAGRSENRRVELDLK